MDHVWESELRYLNRKGFDLTGPYRGNAVMHRSQRETADSIKQTAHGQRSHLDTACTTVFVVLTAAWAV